MRCFIGVKTHDRIGKLKKASINKEPKFYDYYVNSTHNY